MKLSLRSFLYELIFNEKCPICGKQSYWQVAPICSDCWAKIKPLEVNKITKGAFHKDFWKYISALYSYSNYEGTIKEAIHLFKYLQLKRLGKQLGKLLSKIEPPTVDILIPVPLHIKKLRKREFNQSAILAKELSKVWKFPLDLDCLLKIKNTKEQTLLTEAERKENLKNAFIATKNLNNLKVALVDDVVTTGCTLAECAKVLKKIGAHTVYAITLARA
jgi:ComF family protein